VRSRGEQGIADRLVPLHRADRSRTRLLAIVDPIADSRRRKISGGGRRREDRSPER